MTLASAWVLHLFWILPLAVFLLIVEHRRRRQSMEQFAEAALLPRLVLSEHKGKRLVIAILLLSALGLMIFSLAGPRWGSHYQEVSRKGVDIMMMVDVSRSMMVEDVKPNRLERARREILDLLKVIEGDRVGLTIFAGAAFVQCPLTLDYAAVEMFLHILEPGIIPVSGTDLGAAIETALAAFDFKTETDKVLLLITDGEDNEEQGLEAAREAARQGVRIFVFGIGEPSGGPVPNREDKGGFTKDEDGRLVLSRLDEKTLQELASVAGGVYVQSVAGDLDLDLLYYDGIRRKTEAQTLKSGKIKVYEERFPMFILAAFLVLLLEGLLDDKRRPAARKMGHMVLLGLCCLWPLMPAMPLSAAEMPDELYRQGRFEEAQSAYAMHDMENPKDIRYRYNRGCAAFQAGQYPEAAAAFSSVLRRAEDSQVQYKAAYNLGNTAFKQGDYSAAADFYRQALTLHSQNEDARYNLELALQALEQMEQEKQPETGEETSRQSGDQEPEKTKQKPEENGKSSEQGEQEKNRDEGDKPKEEKENGSKDSQAGDGETAEENQDQRSTQSPKPEAESKENLAGDLQPMAEMPEIDHTQAAESNTGTDRKKAEALLDNVQENPAGILRFMVPEEKRHGSASGRDW